MLAYLKEKLNNFSIELEWKKETTEFKPQKPVNDIERFKVLAEKNPNLLDLRERLDLKIGH